jgi:hypothetical protein
MLPRLKPKVAALAEAYHSFCWNVFWISGPGRGDDANRRTFQPYCYGHTHTGTECLVHVKVHFFNKLWLTLGTEEICDGVQEVNAAREFVKVTSAIDPSLTGVDGEGQHQPAN